MVEFLFKKSTLYNTSCSDSTNPSVAECFGVYLNVDSAEVQKAGVLDTCQVVYQKLRIGEFTKNTFFIRLTDIDLRFSSIGEIPRAVSNLE